MPSGTINCSNCGAPLSGVEDRSVVQCSYCGAETALDQDEPDTITAEQVVDTQSSQPAQKESVSEKLVGAWVAHQASSVFFDTCIWPILMALMIIGFFTLLAIRACS